MIYDSAISDFAFNVILLTFGLDHYFLMKISGCLEDNKNQISTEFRTFLSKFKNGNF